MTREKTGKITIQLFGTPTIAVDGTAVTVKRRKARAIVFYLAARDGAVSRQELISVIWPQFERTTALKNLSTYVHDIRSILPGLIRVDKDALSIPGDVSVDARELEKYTSQQNFSVFHDRIVDELYRDSFLKHFHIDDSREYEEWKQNLGEYYLNQVINFKYSVAEAYMESGNVASALDVLNQILKWDPYREDVYKLAMKAYCQAGNRPGAIKLYVQLTNLLKEEFGISPMADTIDMYSELITEDTPSAKNENVEVSIRFNPQRAAQKLTIEDIMPKLSDSSKVLLQILSLCIGKFDFNVLSLLLGVEDKKIFSMLDELREHRVLTIGTDNSIVFLNNKEKEYVSSTISPPQRKYLHFRIAKALEEVCPPSYETVQIMLYHYQHSGENKLILKTAMQVGKMAYEKGDFKTAIGCYEQACQYLSGRDLLELIEYISQMMMIMGDYASATKRLLASAEIAGKELQLGIESCFQLQAHLISIPEYRESIWSCIPSQYAVTLDPESITNIWMGEQYLKNEAENLNFYIMFLHCKASCLEMQMKTKESLEYYRRVLELSLNNPNPWLSNYICSCYLKLGIYEEDIEKADAYLSMGLAYASEKKHRRNMALLLTAACEKDILRGKLDVAEKNLDWAESLDRKYSNLYSTQAIMLARTHLELAKNREQEAVSILSTLLELASQHHFRYMLAGVCRLLLSLESGKEYWPLCRGVLDEIISPGTTTMK